MTEPQARRVAWTWANIEYGARVPASGSCDQNTNACIRKGFLETTKCAARCVACGKEIDGLGIFVDGKMRHPWCYEEPEIRRMIDAAITEVRKSDEHI